MSGPVPATLVAREFWKLSKDRTAPATMLHLIKWSYIAHGWSYPCFGRPLISDPVERWTYGPVYRELYGLLKRFGRKRVDEVPRGEIEIYYKQTNNKELEIDEDQKELVKEIYDAYGKLSGGHLIKLTHKKGGPWDKTRFWNREISQNVIREYYDNLAKTL